MRIKKTDFIIIILCTAISFYLILSNGDSDNKRLVLVVDDKKYPISWQSESISLEKYGIHMIIQVDKENESARVINSDCPDKICVNSGWISACGETAVCLPNKAALIIDCGDNLEISN